MITVQMKREEYERFQAFRGAERTIESIRTQDKLFRKQAEELSEAVLAAMSSDLEGVTLKNTVAARRAIDCAAEILA